MKTILMFTVLGATLLLAACSDKEAKVKAPADTHVVAPQTLAPGANKVHKNVLLHPSTVQYLAPEYDKIKISDYMPAFKQGIEQHTAQINKIARNVAAPTFENTLVAMEKSGALLNRTVNTFFSISGTISNVAIRDIEAKVAPMLSEHRDFVVLNSALFKRIEAIYARRDQLKGPEEKRLVEVYYRNFVHAGAKLSEAQKSHVRELNTQMSKLTTEFSQNLLKTTRDGGVLITDKVELAGLSADDIANLAAAAKAAGKKGYLINLKNTTRHALQSKLANRKLRERLFKASSGRALAENGPIIKKLVEDRAEKAKLLGYPNWAAYKLSNQMAKTPQAVFKMLDDLAPKVMAKARVEAVNIQKIIDATGGKFKLQPWDWAYYAEKVRRQKYDLDEAQIKPYFELNSVLKNGVFFTMNQLFGITFKERHDLPTYNPDVRTFEVFDADGSSIGFFYADYFAREGKRGGAWMNAIVPQNGLLKHKPVVVNVLSIPKPAQGQPALLTFDETTTMFHEMGHAVHALFSEVKYPTLAGTSVPRDFVEFPSQFEEDWAINPRVIANYAKNYKTGQEIPAALLAKVLKSRTFNQGFDTLEYLEAALLDMEWHTIAPGTKIGRIEDFETAALKRHGVYFPPIPPRYKSPYFAHIFAGGYSAGYYAYMWTEVLAADAFQVMREHGGLTRVNGDKFRREILSKGFTLDPMQQYINFSGHRPTVDALLVRRGLVVKKK